MADASNDGAASGPKPRPPSEAKRRLPVLPASELPPEDEDRPPWHWSAVATVGGFVFWIPLIFGANAVTKEPGPLWGALNALAFALANGLAGAIVGRFGGKAGPREAGVGGAITGAIAWVIAFFQTPHAEPLVWTLVLAALLAVGGASAAGGARLSLKRTSSHQNHAS